ARKTQQLLAGGNVSAQAYVKLLKALSEPIQKATEAVARQQGGGRPPALRPYGKALVAALAAGDPSRVTSAHSNLLQALDASLTIGPEQGDKPAASAGIPRS